MLWPFQRAAAKLGVARAGAPTEFFGLPVAQLADPAVRVPATDAFAELAKYTRLLGRPDLGVLAGLAVLPGDFGTTELASRACRTAREGLEVLAHGYELFAEGVHLAIEERGDSVALRLWTDDDVVLPPSAAEFALLAFHQLGSSYVTTTHVPNCVRFTHPPPPHAAAVAEAFGAEVEFDSFENALDYPRAMLDDSLRTANAWAAKAMGARMYELAAVRRRDDVVERVEQDVAQHLRDGAPPPFATIAQRLGTSERTLHRKLKAAGRSYREICDSVRMRVALHYLQETDWSIKEIATRVGFGKVDSFHRAFKRAHGVTPTQRRRHHTQRDGR